MLASCAINVSRVHSLSWLTLHLLAFAVFELLFVYLDKCFWRQGAWYANLSPGACIKWQTMGSQVLWCTRRIDGVSVLVPAIDK